MPKLRSTISRVVSDHERYQWVFIPIRPASTMEDEQGSACKQPLAREWQNAGIEGEAMLRNWAARADFGINCGLSNLVVVDVDEKYIKPEFREATKIICDRLKDLSGGAWANTPGGGLHFYFQQPAERIRNRKLQAYFGQKEPWIETRGDGGYVVAYERHDPDAPAQPCPLDIISAALGRPAPGVPTADAATARAKLATLQGPDMPTPARPPASQEKSATNALPPNSMALQVAAARMAGAQEGERSDTLNREAYALYIGGYEPKDIKAALLPAATQVGLPEIEIHKTLKSAATGAARKLEERTELAKTQGSDERVLLSFAESSPNLRFAFNTTDRRSALPQGDWIEWQADRWVLTNPSEILRRISIVSMENEKKASGILKEAQAVEKLLRLHRTDKSPWNHDPRYFSDAEGRVFDLTARKYLDTPNRDIQIYRRFGTTVDFRKSQVWTDAVKLWTEGDEDLALYLQRVMGYCFYPGNPEQVFFYFYGGGSNGKSKFFETYRQLFGEYGCLLNPNMFVRRQNGDKDARSDLTLLQHKRFALAHELPQGAHWDEALLKQVTGDETVQVRRLYEMPYEIRMLAKFFLHGNSKPIFTDGSQGWKRRLHLVPFLAKLKEGKNADKHFLRKLMVELPRILGWTLEGFYQWQEVGLSPPGRVLAETDRYLTDYGSGIARFVADRLESGEKFKVTIARLKAEYDKWREAEGDRASQLSGRMLRAQLEEAGYKVAQVYGTGGYQYHLMGYNFKADPIIG